MWESLNQRGRIALRRKTKKKEKHKTYEVKQNEARVKLGKIHANSERPQQVALI